MSRKVRVILSIGDIYSRKSTIPPPFDRMKEAFEGEPDKDLIEIMTIGKYEVKIIAISHKKCLDLVNKLEDTRSWRPFIGEPRERHKAAIKEVISEREPSPVKHSQALKPHIVFIGQTPYFEAITDGLAEYRDKTLPFNPLIVRVSSFYSKISSYTNRSAKEVGYNLDMFKNLDDLISVLRNEPFLQAVIDQKEELLLSAIGSLNEQEGLKEHPILIV